MSKQDSSNNNPPAYAEQPDLLDALEQATREEQVDVEFAEPETS